MSDENESVAAERRATIGRAALAAFSERGLAKTSMAAIAERAGISRPALYQYFANKGDIFRFTMRSVFTDAAAAALAELDRPGAVAEQLDGYLQRYHGDLKALLKASQYADELLTFLAENGSDLDAAANEALHRGLGEYLDRLAPGGGLVWQDLLETAPLGFKNDHPPLDLYRQRLTTLAAAVAAGIEA